MGTIIILKNAAALFVDGRYTLQAQKQIDTKIYEIENYDPHSIMSWVLKKSASEKIVLGYDAWDYTVSQLNMFQKIAPNINFKQLDRNPIDEIWDDKPNISKTKIFLHPEKYSGESWKQKLESIQNILKTQNLDAIFLTSSSSICWLLNIRGHDVPFTPISLCYAIVYKTGKIDLFVYLENLTEEIVKHFQPTITFHRMSGLELTEKLPKLLANLRVGYTEKQAPMRAKNIIAPSVIELINMEDPCVLLRACKNKTQLKHIEETHIEDGIALAKFFCWIDDNYKTESINEYTAAEKIDSFRFQNKNCIDLSFPTISGTAQNGSIVHYRAGENPLPLTEGDIFLCDSGGQYYGGTTDVTRTICLGKNPTPEQKKLFTLVLKGLVVLSCAEFPEGVTGGQLDLLARQFLWKEGHDYAHATGHGVGQYANVHEGPQNISPRATTVPLREGMVLSNEPGCYIEGQFGIRIENLMYVSHTGRIDSFGRKILKFNTLTFCPIDRSCIDITLLTNAEKEWIDAYHNTVWEKLSPHVDTRTKDWLKKETAPL